MWFCLWLLRDKHCSFYLVAPTIKNENEVWKGFGGLNAAELKKCFEQRMEIDKSDTQLGKRLWEAFRFGDKRELQSLGEMKSETFPKLKELCRAASEIEVRPKEKLREIISKGAVGFDEIFAQFSQSEGAYGFGDAQVKRILSEI